MQADDGELSADTGLVLRGDAGSDSGTSGVEGSGEEGQDEVDSGYVHVIAIF